MEEFDKKVEQYKEQLERVFAIKGGSAELHFDKEGNLRKIVYHNQEIVS